MIIWAENFEAFGTNAAALLDGLFIERGSSFGVGETATILEIPPFEEDGRYWLSVGARGAGLRRPLFGVYDGIGWCIGFRLGSLPTSNNRLRLIEMRDSSNDRLYSLDITTDGNLRVTDGSNNVLVTTSNSPIAAGNYYILQLQATAGAGNGEIEVRVSGQGTGAGLVPVIGGTSSVPANALTLPGSITQVRFGTDPSSVVSSHTCWVKFVLPYSLTGTYNNDWPLISGVALLRLTSDVSAQNFTPRPYQMFGPANLLIGVDGTGDVLDCSAGSEFHIGAADFTIEGTFRPSGVPTGTQEAVLFGLWREATSHRSYRLVKYGPSTNNGALRFEVSEDGTLSDVTPVISLDYDFEVGHQYHIAVCRDAGTTRLFINGDQAGVDAADAHTYFDVGVNAKFTVGGEMSNVSTGVRANTSFKGRVDEVRFTNGVARYTTDFSPPGIFPRNISGDPDFNSVVLLAGFDEGVIDESPQLNTLVPRGDTARRTTNDTPGMYRTVNQIGVTDDRFLEAPFLPAQGVFTLTDLPLDTETVTIGSRTYTFVAALSVANDVLIGADVTECLQNLIDAINNGPGEGTTYGAGTAVNTDVQAALGPEIELQMTVTAILAGVAGNSIGTTDTVTDGSWKTATLAGGADIPAPVEFTFEPLPIEATGLRALLLFDRAFLNADNGSAQKSFVVDGQAADGSDNSLSNIPTYRFDVIEEDPDTLAGLTPQSVLVGRFRYTRTA